MSTADHRPLTTADVMLASEVAELLRVPVSTVYALAKRGEIPSQKIGRHVRFVRSQIEAIVTGGGRF